MSVQRGDAELVKELETALLEGEWTTARSLTSQSVSTADADAVLTTLAVHASSSSQAVELLIEALDAGRTVHRFVGAALLDQAAVDDVAQEALISVMESISSYNGRSQFTTWVHTIVRRRVVDHLRRQRESSPLPDEDLTPGARMSSMIATRATVREVLQKLPELYRVPVVLRDVEGRPYAEIAERLDRPEGTVKAQINRGRAMVAAQLRPDPAAERA